MPDLSPADIQKLVDGANRVWGEAEAQAKAWGIDPSKVGTDPGKLLAASGSGAVAGAGLGAALGSVFPGPGTAIGTAIGAIVGAIAGFIAKFKTGPTAEQLKLTAEFDALNHAVYEILQTVPEPYRDQLARELVIEAKKYPGTIPFCVGYGGCALTSMEGVRAAGAGVQKLAEKWIATAKKRQRPGFGIAAAALGVAAAGLGAAWLVSRSSRNAPKAAA